MILEDISLILTRPGIVSRDFDPSVHKHKRIGIIISKSISRWDEAKKNCHRNHAGLLRMAHSQVCRWLISFMSNCTAFIVLALSCLASCSEFGLSKSWQRSCLKSSRKALTLQSRIPQFPFYRGIFQCMCDYPCYKNYSLIKMIHITVL